MEYSAEYWINKLDLISHPEGGHFREVYRSEETILSGENKRNISTSIYFLLKSGEISAFHKIKSDELWHFYSGSGLTIYVLESSGDLSLLKVGNNPENGEVFQSVVKANNWFAAKVNDPDTYALVGCTVAPGFDFSDFELASESELISQYPQHQDIIKRFTLR